MKTSPENGTKDAAALLRAAEEGIAPSVAKVKMAVRNIERKNARAAVIFSFEAALPGHAQIIEKYELTPRLEKALHSTPVVIATLGLSRFFSDAITHVQEKRAQKKDREELGFPAGTPVYLTSSL